LQKGWAPGSPPLYSFFLRFIIQETFLVRGLAALRSAKPSPPLP
jgi:hypothetical protein